MAGLLVFALFLVLALVVSWWFFVPLGLVTALIVVANSG